MLRTRLIGAALLTLAFLPGCRLFDPDRPRLFERCRERHSGQAPAPAAPVSYSNADAGCGATVIPPATPGAIYGQPIYVGPNGSLPGSETLPPPIAPRIPKAGIEEKGKQYELEKGGPVLSMPAVNIKP